MKKFIALSGAALIALCHGTAWSAEAAAADAPPH